MGSVTSINADTPVIQTSRALLVRAVFGISRKVIATLTRPTEQFTQFYYKTFDENRSALGALYVWNTFSTRKLSQSLTSRDVQKEQSMLTFENSPTQGTAAIAEKLVVCTTRRHSASRNLLRHIRIQNLPFSKVQHEVASLDAQPSSESGGILVLVSGRLLVRT